MPAHSLSETRIQIERMLDSIHPGILRLVVAGDLVESPRRCRRTEADVEDLRAWLASRGVTLCTLQGNHDPRPRRVDAVAETCEIAGWTIGHGHRPIVGTRTMSGHLHPMLRWGRVTSPCFLVSPERIILPAFSRNAAGWNVSASLEPVREETSSLRCLAATDTDLLDFGPIRSLRGHLA